ncbi:A/G-specific adenine glycosylase [Ghiorsea bivora]|uniref:A/G-specific adenine glycosylase n=1 Tax=Ghiorsea bivora TaxID=1485545 RepID=UPI0009DE2C43|nr:NUDIX domain-containing protein [Ghiorsea bivora]
MLQQTQVKTVLPRYTEWFEVFPDIKTLAAAHIDDVFKQWEGLGYYRRARFIHEAAQHITKHFNGVFPANFEDILSLKGIGRSTAGAISSFCFQTATPVLDGNVKRVLSTWQKDDLNEKALWQLAQNYIDQCNQPDTWNQAMMELGATLCQARKRNCETCPMTSTCQSAFTEPLKKTSTIKMKDVYWQVFVHQHQQHGIWLEQRPENGIWAGLWTPPIIELAAKPKHKPNLVHQLTHRRIHLYLKDEQSEPTGHGQWFTSWEGLAVPTGIHRLFEQRVTD